MPTHPLRAKYVIAGIGSTSFGKLPEWSTLSMNVEACRRATLDARIDPRVVDGLFVKFPTSAPRSMFGQELAEALAIQPALGGGWQQGGASNITQIAMACMAIDAGMCDVALVTFADNPRTGSRAAFHKALGTGAEPYGWFGNPAGYAMIARRHMEEFGTTPEALAEIAVTCRKHASVNPAAQLRESIDVDDYLAAPFVVDPFRRPDCCLISDGGAAVVVMSAQRAQQLDVSDPVPILGFGSGNTSWQVAVRPSLTETCAGHAAKSAFAMAGVGPRDVDVAELYDCFSIVPLVTIEDYGFCPKGQGGWFVTNEGISIDGALPMNTSGGLLAETGMPGMQHVLEGVRQIRGTSVNQVANARVAVVSNQGGVMHTHSTLVLGR